MLGYGLGSRGGREAQEPCSLCGLGKALAARTDVVLPFYLDALLWPLVSQQEPASTMGGAGETSEETSGQVR